MSDLWNTGDDQISIVHGQAGKPFYHDRGPRLKFPDDPDTVVYNSFYCSILIYAVPVPVSVSSS